MKTYKNYNAFKKRIQSTTDWGDFMKIGGLQFKMYEYGGGSMFHMGYHYAYWLNKKTMTAIYIKYHLPSIDWVINPHTGKRERVEKGRYQFIEMEIQPNFEPWRTDTI